MGSYDVTIPATDSAILVSPNPSTNTHDTYQSDDKPIDCVSKASTSSTALYCQEPFGTFEKKVTQVCAIEFGNSKVIIKHMDGGSYNRVTALTVCPPPAKLRLSWLCSLIPFLKSRQGLVEPNEYILRNLRSPKFWKEWGMPYDVRVLAFARAHLGSIVPQIIRWNIDANNMLSQPYMIQERLPGQNLDKIWKTLTLAQKKSALHIVVDITKKLQTITSNTPGVLVPTDDPQCISSDASTQLCTFKVGHPSTMTWTKEWSTPATQQTTLEFLQEQADRWHDYEGHVDPIILPYWRAFRKLSQKLQEMGLLRDDDMFYFCHLDLYPRNLLVEIVDESTLKLTGLIDWDAAYAHFCPRFVAYRAPFWLWQEDGVDEWDEMLAMTEPTNPDLAQLKRLFEQLADDRWKQYAFSPEYALARRMFKYLRDGMFSNDSYDDVENIIEEWQKLHFDEKLDLEYVFHHDCNKDKEHVTEIETDSDTSGECDEEIEEQETNEQEIQEQEPRSMELIAMSSVMLGNSIT
ncbi:hypothetical protein BKA66DRAFT_574511 [Pyrenochaeta sp. MPI-SDFR-AT-0127]|nr:hypothetical protein BKA66DRAFT_574511 [Pyrenochaeta sp. MPI-SDFR-AT-0127]